MQLEALYDHGKIELIHPVQLKHKRIKSVVNIPDSEIVEETRSDSQEAIEPMGKSELLNSFDEILKPYQKQLSNNNHLNAEDYKEIWHQHLEEKYLGG
jgi:hypothetical protein